MAFDVIIAYQTHGFRRNNSLSNAWLIFFYVIVQLYHRIANIVCFFRRNNSPTLILG